ncbi:hypothetical protein GCM10009815_20340 [Nocardioides marmoribigeumensis]|uniref:sunset domain-containing protein n=1 Tax=Nocardioides marmoribigeumensis TaxID=433649 RepID=UPI0031CE7DBC
MTWVAQELAPWLVLAFVLGVVAGAALSLTRVSVEKWVEVPLPPAPEPETAEEDTTPATPVVETGTAPEEPVFPTLEDGAWEQEEAWSRPVRPVRASTQSSAHKDEWDDAAANWRTWADEAAGREASATDEPEPREPLPGGDRRVAGAAPAPPSSPARSSAEPSSAEPDPFPTALRRGDEAPASGSRSDHDLFAADRAADGGPEAWDDRGARAPLTSVDDVVVPPPSPASDADLFAADRTAHAEEEQVFPDAVFPDPEPEPVVEREPEPVAEPEPEPEPVVEPEYVEAVAPPEPEEQPAPPRVEHSPFDSASGGFVRRRRSELRQEPEPAVELFPEPEPAPAPEPSRRPEPVADVFPTYEPAPAPEPEPEPAPEPEPVADVFPAYEPEPEPVAAKAPEPEPEPEPEDEEPYVPPVIHGPAGPGSMYAPIDGSVPKNYPIKGQASTMLYFPKGAKFYTHVVADVYFDTAEAAEHAGFTRWDRRGSAAHVIRPNAED